MYQVVTMDTELLAHVVSEEAQGLTHFAAAVLKIGTEFVMALQCMQVLCQSAPVKFFWIWPSPFARAVKSSASGRLEASSAVAGSATDPAISGPGGSTGAAGSRPRVMDLVTSCGRAAREGLLGRLQEFEGASDSTLRAPPPAAPEARPRVGDTIRFKHERRARAHELRSALI